MKVVSEVEFFIGNLLGCFFVDYMRELTVKRARKILGKSAENISDEDLLVEIKAAQLLKNLFFSNLLKQSSSNYTQGTHGEKANITKT